MDFSRFSEYLQKLEATASRNKMTEILAELFSKADTGEIDKICYLSLGRLLPKFAGVEFNIAEKMMIKIISRAFEIEEKRVVEEFKKRGDLGEVAYKNQKSKIKNQKSKVSVLQVYDALLEIAKESGEGSVERKIEKMAKLIRALDPLSCKYVVRIPLGKLRLGFSDVTILDALSWMKVKDKSLRPQLEAAYNVSADIGKIAKVFKSKGIGGLKKIKCEPGIPIRPALAERLPSGEKILEKLGKCAAEPKYDGFRTSIHLDKSRPFEDKRMEELGLFKKEKYFVKIFSRNMEDTTYMFPEIVEAAGKLKAKSAILDGEAIGYNPKTGKFLPFQETVQRKRKYGIAQMKEKLPLRVFAFDLLYLNGKSLLEKPFSFRRKLLEKIIKSSSQNVILLTEQRITKNLDELEEFFNEAVKRNLEGLVCKKLDSFYQAGARNFNWVKYKKAMKGELADTVDCLVLGYYRGRGKRAGFGIGAFLCGVYNQKTGKFPTIAKIGTGLTDQQWREMKRFCDKLKVGEKPKEYLVDKNLFCDVWCRPSLVVEIQADEITKSPVHKTGFALRFPRLLRFRKKDPEEATTVEEIKRLYKMQ